MYFRLVTNSDDFGGTQNLNDAHRRYVMDALYQVIHGGITTVSQLSATYFNKAACVIQGARPTAGIYTAQGSNTTSSASYNDHYWTIRKHHYGKTINASYTPYRDIYMRWNNNWGQKMRMFTNGVGTNGVPTTEYNASDWCGNSNSTNAIYNVTDGLANEWYSWEGIVNDKVFVLRYNQKDHLDGWHGHFIVADQEYQPDLDNYLHGAYNDWCPSVLIMTQEKKLERNETRGVDTGTNDMRNIYVGKNQVVGQNTSGYNTNWIQHSHYHNGYYSTQNAYSNYASTWPPMWHEMPQKIPMANGDNAYIIQPLMYEGDYGTNIRSNQHRDWKGKARMMNMYRTNDDSFYTGERVTDAEGNVYRAFRIYKHGGATGTHHGSTAQVSKNGVYLFPEGGT